MKYSFFVLYNFLINFSFEQKKPYCDLNQNCEDCSICGKDSNNYCSCNYYNIYCKNGNNYTILTDFIYSYDGCLVSNGKFENICGSSNIDIDIGITKIISIKSNDYKEFFCFYNIKKIRNNNNDINIFVKMEGNKYTTFNLHLIIYYNYDEVKVSSWMDWSSFDALEIVESKVKKISVFIDIPDGRNMENLQLFFSMENTTIKKVTYVTNSNTNTNRMLVIGIILGVLFIILIIVIICLIKKYCYRRTINGNNTTTIAEMTSSSNDKILINRNKEKMNYLFKTQLVPSTYYKKNIVNDCYKCTICLEEFKDGSDAVITTKCNHCFHDKCFIKWVHKNIIFPKCPNCNQPIIEGDNNNSQNNEIISSITNNEIQNSIITK